MSRYFYIKNSKAPEVMSAEELLINVQNKEFINYSVTPKDENYESIISSPINEFGVFLFGQDGISGRGFEVGYDEEQEYYNVRVFTPSTKYDWLGAFKFIENLAIYLGVEVIDEEEEVYEPNNITYDYLGDIDFGIQTFKGKEGQFIFGVNRPVSLNAEILEKLFSAEDRVAYFSKFMEEQQHIDAYMANPKFYQKNSKNKTETMGMLTITRTVPTILPYEAPPFIDITKYTISQEEIDEWNISFVTINGDENDINSYKTLGYIDYKTFLNRLPKDKIQKLDGHYMLLTLSDEEKMLSILHGDKKSDSVFFNKIKRLFK